MTGSDSIDVSGEALWQCWRRFIKGKRRTPDLMNVEFHVERELRSLSQDLRSGNYEHGPYRTFVVRDPKERTISVAPVRDRIVHRLLYDELVGIFDRHFMFDVWSARKGKGLTRALERMQCFVRQYRDGYFWRADIHRFFDHVDHAILFGLLQRRVHDARALHLMSQVITSFSVGESRERERERERVRGAGSRSGISRARFLRMCISMNLIGTYCIR